MKKTIPFPSESFLEDYIYGVIAETGFCPVSGEYVDFKIRQPNFGK